MELKRDKNGRFVKGSISNWKGGICVGDKKKYYREYCRKWRMDNKDKVLGYQRKCDKKRIGKRSEYNKLWLKKNRDKVNERRRKYNKDRRKSDIKFRLDMNFANAIGKVLRGRNISKGFREWEKLVGYSVDELMLRLESLFTSDMKWDNYGLYWSIDHIKPKSLFVYDNADDAEFRKCWALENLQPLKVKDNLIKSNKF